MSETPRRHPDDPGGGVSLLSLKSGPVADARRLTRASVRREEGRFLVEGPQAVREAAAAGRLETLFATPDGAARNPELAVDHLVDERALAALADAVTPQGVVGVSSLVTVTAAEALAGATRLVAVLVEPRDPGNLGAVIRTADAAGADAVLVLGEAVDVHNGKAVRASAGSVFHLPIGTGSLSDAADLLQGKGFQLLAADGYASVSLPAAEAQGLLDRPTAWVFGTEAQGMDAATRDRCDAVVAVPLHGAAESLNLAAAAAVCLYASARAQRWQTPTL